ncbi:MAG: CoA transferase, partial [Dehalococcoidia bacterium]
LGVPELIYDARFETPGLRTQHHAELEPILNEALMQKTTAEWLIDLEPLQIPCGPLQTIPEAAHHPQVQAREMLVPVRSERGNEVTIPNSPIKLSRTPAAIRGGPPTTGRDTREVLASLLGMTDAEIDAAFATGAAAVPEELPAELTQ